MQARIGVDGYNIALPRGTGVATYGVALADTLRAMGHEVTGVFGLTLNEPVATREAVFFDRLQREPPPRRGIPYASWLPDLARGIRGPLLAEVPLTDLVDKRGFEGRFPRFDRLVNTADLFRIAHRRFMLTGRFLTVRMREPPAIMHWTYPVPVRLEGARNIYTLHDIVPLKLPYMTLDRKRSYYRLLQACVRDATHICTVSEASRRDILAQFPADPERITNCYQTSPLPHDMFAEDAAVDAQVVEGLLGLQHRGYFLYYGAIEPKKNVGRLVEAYLASGSATPLVIVGRAWNDQTDIRISDTATRGDAVVPGRRGDRIVRLDYLPRPLLLKVIRGARAVTFPSLYEGFGLPILEAMQLGTPVLSSNVSAVPEVAGTAAVLVDPYRVGAIAEGLRRLDRDGGLRDDLQRAGQVQAEAFSTTRYRERLSAMYARILV